MLFATFSMTSFGSQASSFSRAEYGSASDEDLFAAIAKGDEIAFATVVDRFLPRLLAIGRRMLGNPIEADDVAQEAFLRVWTRSALWRPGGAKVSTWLHRITVNLCIDRLRRRTYQPLEEAEWVPDSRADPARDAHLGEMKRAIDAALAALPGKQKAAIVLCHYEGFSGKEAAQILGISVLAVQSLLVRARASLRTALADYAELGDVA